MLTSKTSLPTITVALSAYNEASNIGNFLESILAQKEEGFKIVNIWVYNDGSTDQTTQIVKTFKDPRIQLLDDAQRLGKSSRLNSIYTNLTTDLLVQSDADIVMPHPYVIRDLIRPLIREKKVGMCGGHPKPYSGTTLTEKAVNCTVEAYTPFKTEIRGGNNIFSVDGRLLAYKKELVKQIHIPDTMTSNDKFTYYSCLMAGYDYRYVATAIVMYRSPQTLKDQIKQNGRFLCSPIKHSRIFPKELVKRETYIPRSLLITNSLKQFLYHPILCSYIFFVNLYCRLRVNFVEKKTTARWQMAVTTKSLS